MKETKIRVDDWNVVFKNIPREINNETFKVLNNLNAYYSMERYNKLKLNIQDIISDVGDYEVINYLSGDQAIQQAVVIGRKYLDINKIILVTEAYHGITFGLLRNNKIQYEGIEILEFRLKDLALSLDSYVGERTLLILEPLLFFAHMGEKGIEQMKKLCHEAKKKKCRILFDEVRSGVFCTGTFLFAQQMSEIKPDIICFAKGLALGTATSVIALEKNIFSDMDIRKEDVLKSNLSISEVAMQRANDLIEYYKRNKELFMKSLSATSRKISNSFKCIQNIPEIAAVNIKGLCCIVVFSPKLKRRRLNIIRHYMLVHNISVRQFEENILYINFAIDSSDEEISEISNVIKEALVLING